MIGSLWCLHKYLSPSEDRASGNTRIESPSFSSKNKYNLKKKLGLHKNIQISPDISTGKPWPNYQCDSQGLCFNLIPLSKVFQWTLIKRKTASQASVTVKSNMHLATHAPVCQIIKVNKNTLSCPSSNPIPLILLHSLASQSQGCQAGSMRHRLSRLFAAATRVLTLLSPPSNWARLWRRVMMAVTAFWTNETNCWESMFSGWPAGDRGMEVSSWVFLCQAIISSRRTAFRMPSTYQRQESDDDWASTDEDQKMWLKVNEMHVSGPLVSIVFVHFHTFSFFYSFCSLHWILCCNKLCKDLSCVWIFS